MFFKHRGYLLFIICLYCLYYFYKPYQANSTQLKNNLLFIKRVKMDVKIGILGGGQLAMMMTEAAYKIGINDITVIDPNVNCPASKVGAKQIVSSFIDEDNILLLASQVDVLTVDIESINIDALFKAKELTTVIPDPSSLSIIQNKRKQKEFLVNSGIPIPFYCDVDKIPDKWTTFILKTRWGGYDGKGVWKISSKEELNNFLKESGMIKEQLFVEEYIPFKKELAVISFTSEHHKEPINYPIVETVQENGICTSVVCPTPLDQDVRDEVNRIVKKIITSFGSYGIFAVELFLTEDNKVLVNEVSPRVHNSGHYTIEGTNCSQFEQHIRIITGMQTIEPKLTVSPIKMTNILAKGDHRDMPLTLYKKYGSNYHWYNKTTESTFKPKRKIGHITQSLSLQETPYPLVYIVMGSSSDLPTLMPAIDLLNEYDIPIKVDVVSAHRSPEWMYKFGKNIESWCGKVIIAAAGGAAHLPGMLASLTTLPVIGVPVPSKYLRGEDSLLSIVEMPDGVPVATVGIGKAKNAAIMALKILGVESDEANKAVVDITNKNKEKVINQRKDLVKRFE